MGGALHPQFFEALMIRTATPADVMHVADNIRTDDEKEVRALSGLSPLESMTMGIIHSSHAVTGVGRSGSPILIAGVIRRNTQEGSIWMLSTPEIRANARIFTQEASEWLESLKDDYQQLRNVVLEENRLHVRLLEWLGFKFGAPIENYGVGKVRVLPFKR